MSGRPTATAIPFADATEAIFLDQDNAAAYAIRANCRLAIGDADGAAHDAQEVFRIDPTRPPSIPTSPPDPPKNDPTTTVQDSRRARGRDDSVFADGNAVDRSLKARMAFSSDDAAEHLADLSGYRPEIIARPLPRTRRSGSRSGRPSSLIFPAICVCILLVVGFVRAKRGQPEARTPKPAAEVVKEVDSTDPIEPVRVEHAGSRKSPIRRASGDQSTDRRNSDPSNDTNLVSGRRNLGKSSSITATT